MPATLCLRMRIPIRLTITVIAGLRTTRRPRMPGRRSGRGWKGATGHPGRQRPVPTPRARSLSYAWSAIAGHQRSTMPAPPPRASPRRRNGLTETPGTGIQRSPSAMPATIASTNAPANTVTISVTSPVRMMRRPLMPGRNAERADEGAAVSAQRYAASFDPQGDAPELCLERDRRASALDDASSATPRFTAPDRIAGLSDTPLDVQPRGHQYQRPCAYECTRYQYGDHHRDWPGTMIRRLAACRA